MPRYKPPRELDRIKKGLRAKAGAVPAALPRGRTMDHPSKTSVPGAKPLVVVRRTDGLHLKGEWPEIVEVAPSMIGADVLFRPYDGPLHSVVLIEGAAVYRKRGETDAGMVVMDLVEKR